MLRLFISIFFVMLTSSSFAMDSDNYEDNEAQMVLYEAQGILDQPESDNKLNALDVIVAKIHFLILTQIEKVDVKKIKSVLAQIETYCKQVIPEKSKLILTKITETKEVINITNFIAATARHTAEVVTDATQHAVEVVADATQHAVEVVADATEHAAGVVADATEHTAKVINKETKKAAKEVKSFLKRLF